MRDIFDLLPKKTVRPVPQGPVEYLIVGLGNPGAKYASTRHNAGFCGIDALAEKCGVKIDRLKFKSLLADATLAEKHILLMKPQTFMNNSGEAVVDALNFYKLPPERLIVISDDISLEAGRIRIRLKGSAGGHNGLKSIIYLTGKDTFPRIRLGVGAKPEQWDLADWVLASPTGDDAKHFAAAIAQVPEICRMMVAGKAENAMNLFNRFDPAQPK